MSNSDLHNMSSAEYTVGVRNIDPGFGSMFANQGQENLPFVRGNSTSPQELSRRSSTKSSSPSNSSYGSLGEFPTSLDLKLQVEVSPESLDSGYSIDALLSSVGSKFSNNSESFTADSSWTSASAKSLEQRAFSPTKPMSYSSKPIEQNTPHKPALTGQGQFSPQALQSIFTGPSHAFASQPPFSPLGYGNQGSHPIPVPYSRRASFPSYSPPQAHGLGSVSNDFNSAMAPYPFPNPNAHPSSHNNQQKRNPLPLDGYVYQVQFKRAYKNYVLSPYAPRNLAVGDLVKVEADRGEDLGVILSKTRIQDFEEVMPTAGYRGRGFASGQGERKFILRLASPEEREAVATKVYDEEVALQTIREKIMERGLVMSILDAEYQYDRHKLTFYFEANRRIDFRELVSELFSQYKTRIWMQQVDTSVLDPHDLGTELAKIAGLLPERGDSASQSSLSSVSRDFRSSSITNWSDLDSYHSSIPADMTVGYAYNAYRAATDRDQQLESYYYANSYYISQPAWPY